MHKKDRNTLDVRKVRDKTTGEERIEATRRGDRGANIIKTVMGKASKLKPADGVASGANNNVPSIMQRPFSGSDAGVVDTPAPSTARPAKRFSDEEMSRDEAAVQAKQSRFDADLEAKKARSYGIQRRNRRIIADAAVRGTAPRRTDGLPK